MAGAYIPVQILGGRDHEDEGRDCHVRVSLDMFNSVSAQSILIVHDANDPSFHQACKRCELAPREARN